MSVTPITSQASAPSGPFNASAMRNATPATQRAAVAAQFEAILVRQLLGKTMTSMLGGAEGGASASIYGDMLSDTVAQQLSAGQGLGLGRYLQQQLTPRGEKTEAAADVSTPTSTRASTASFATPLSS